MEKNKMDVQELTKETYNQIAADWHQDHTSDDWWVNGFNHFLSLLPQGGQLLDVGCGSGVKAQYAIDQGYKVLGIDFSEKLLEIARREVPEAVFENIDMYTAKSALSRDTFDGIYAQASLLHIPKVDAENVVASIATLLKKDGFFYIAVKGVKEGRAEEEIKEESDYGYPYRRFFSYYTPEEIEGYLENGKCEIVFSDVLRSGSTDWVQVIGKRI